MNSIFLGVEIMCHIIHCTPAERPQDIDDLIYGDTGTIPSER